MSAIVSDMLFSSLIIAPSVIGYWRGTWGLSDEYIFPNNLMVNIIVSAVIGTFVQIAFTFSQEYMQKHIRPDNHGIFHYFMSKMYTYIYSLACINMWRGTWKTLDFYSGTNTLRVIIPTLVSFVAVVVLKATRNLTSVPFLVVIDAKLNYFSAPTMFKLTKSSDLPWFILDCFFSVFIIGSLVVFIWRGVWCLTDVFLFPENEKYSAIISLIIGYILTIFIFSIQNPLEHFSKKLTGLWRLLIADIFVFVSFIATINLWRGIWNLLNIYFLPDFPIWSYWINHLGCFAFLVLIKCSNTVLVRGVYLDGEDGIIFPAFYFTIFIEKLKKKETEDERNARIHLSNNQSSFNCAEKDPNQSSSSNSSGGGGGRKYDINNAGSSTDFV